MLATALLASALSVVSGDDDLPQLEHGFADSNGVKIHYVTAGEGPLVVMVHGFPDFWYTWRNQIPALARRFQVVAMDMRGYNKSDQPDEVEQYQMEYLVGDVLAVVDHFTADEAVIVGHDWGGAVAWQFAMNHPGRTLRLGILNLPHPKGMGRELANNQEQKRNSQYARNFQRPDAHKKLTAESLAGWVTDTDARVKYVEAFKRSSMKGMLAYYKANYPRHEGLKETDVQSEAMNQPSYPAVECPVLMIHGLKDPYLLAAGLSGTWDWIDAEFTLVTIPEASHFVQHDAAEAVTRNLVRWLSDVGE